MPEIGVDRNAARQILRDILAAEIKAGDAPASALAHIDRALVAIKRLCGGWMPDNEEMAARMREAEIHMAIYEPTGGQNEG